MTAPSPRILAFLVLAGTLLVPAASADAGQVTAERASYSGGADHDGSIVAFFLATSPEFAADDALLSIDIHAGRFESLQVERRYIVSPEVDPVTLPRWGEVPALVQPVEDPRFDRNAPPARTVLDKARATLVSQQEEFQVHILPADPAAALDFQGHTDAGQFSQLPALFMETGRFEEPRPSPLDTDARVINAPEFWSVRLDEPLVVHDDQASHFQARIKGDLVLEIVGGTFEAKDRDEQVTLESGKWSAPAVPGSPLPGATEERRVLMRLFLEDATIHVGFQGATTDAYWASRSVESTTGGDTTLEGASGDVSTSDGIVPLSDDRYRVAAATLLTLTPGDAGMAVAMQPAVSTAATAGQSGPGQGQTVAGIAAILALLVAAGLGLAHRLAAAPDLRQVELALEGERYGRAARIAKRILRARPGLEDAVLGRAIALSKSGRAGAAISEIHEHLATRGASDGSLHYVLGLSFLDVGREAEASIALAEAVRRTPALQADVAARLGPVPSHSTPTTLREVHGYA